MSLLGFLTTYKKLLLCCLLFAFWEQGAFYSIYLLQRKDAVASRAQAGGAVFLFGAEGKRVIFSRFDNVPMEEGFDGMRPLSTLWNRCCPSCY